MKRYDDVMQKLHGNLILQRENEIILELRFAKEELKEEILSLKSDVGNGFTEANTRFDNLEKDVVTIKYQLTEIITLLKK